MAPKAKRVTVMSCSGCPNFTSERMFDRDGGTATKCKKVNRYIPGGTDDTPEWCPEKP